jgi:alpha-amylase
LKKHPEFKVSFSLSGVFLEQLAEFAPEVLESFQDLVDTGRVEILGETYYHSLSFLFDKQEFREQVKLHSELVKKLFGVEPSVFKNTELIYNNELANEVGAMGYEGIVAEGADHLLELRSPNFLYSAVGLEKIKVLLNNYKLSDDIAAKFSNREWADWPLTASKYVKWLNSLDKNEEVVNLVMDYETFGEHQNEDSGIFDFLRYLPGEFLKRPGNNFKTLSEAVASYEVCDEYDCHSFISKADIEKDLSTWRGNEIQEASLKKIYDIGKRIKLTGNAKLVHNWRKLQTSDHFYYMSTKWFKEGDSYRYFNPYDSPYDAFISYMNVLQDLEMEVDEILEERGFLKDGKIVTPRINL